MNYALAKKLKDAGFISNGQVWCQELKEILPRPTLEELIEACGDNFRKLEVTLLPSKQWHCTGYSVSTTDMHSTFHGATPTEAVARLWLVLNATVQNSDRR